MLITPINNYKYNYQPNFGYRYSLAFDKKTSELLYRTTSKFFRTDLNWQRFIKLAGDMFVNASTVSVMNHACSSGEESYSMALKLIDSFKGKADKFFPIFARDIDQENIEIANSGALPISVEEMCQLEDNLSLDMWDYYDIEKGWIFNNYATKSGETRIDTEIFKFVPQKKLKDKILFSQGDIFQDIDSIPDKNTILLCRNVWPYFSHSQQEYLLSILAQKFRSSSSLLVLGSFDFKQKFKPSTSIGTNPIINPVNRMKEFLEKYNFVETNVQYVYLQR